MRKLKQAWRLGGLTWAELGRRLWQEMWKDDIPGKAAQAAFYCMLALVPLLALLIGLFGALSDPDTLRRTFETLAEVLPTPVAKLLADQIKDIGERPPIAALSLSALLTLWAASGAYSSLATCLNSVYDVQERRPFWRTTAVAIGMTLLEGVLVIVGAGLILSGTDLGTALADRFGLGGAGHIAIEVLRWVLVLATLSLALALLYFTGPDVDQEWVWITPGSVMATLLWVLLDLGFRFYVANFGNYNATYGALGGIIVLLLWLYLSAAAILLGGELNAIIEHAAPEGKRPGEHVAGGPVDKPVEPEKAEGAAPAVS